MESQFSHQLLVFGQSILLGFCAGLVYDLLRPFRLRLPRLTGVLDALYCLLTGVAIFLFLLRGAEGELRGFVVLGALGGAILFFCVFSESFCGPYGPFGRTLWPIWHICCPCLFYGGKIFAKKLHFTEKSSFIFGGNAIQ